MTRFERATLATVSGIALALPAFAQGSLGGHSLDGGLDLPSSVSSTTVAQAALSSPQLPAMDKYSRLARDMLNNLGATDTLTDQPAQLVADAFDYTHLAFLRGNYVAQGASQIALMQAVAPLQEANAIRRVEYDVIAMGYLNDLTPWTVQAPLIQAMLKAGLLRYVEGPNEVNNYATGNGSRGPNDGINKTNAYVTNIQDWDATLLAFKAANLGYFTAFGVGLIAPSVASILGGQADYPLNDQTSLVDATNVHFYAGGGRQPSFSDAVSATDGYYGNVVKWATAANSPVRQFVESEGGAVTTPTQYTSAGQAKYELNYLFDCFKAGARSCVIYKLFDDNTANASDTENYGLWQSNGLTPKVSGYAVRAWQNSLAINTNADDPANAPATDVIPFKPQLTPSLLTISGLNNVAESELSTPLPGVLIAPKSDGTSVVFVTNEPVINSGGVDVTPPTSTVTLSYPVSHTWCPHDLINGGDFGADGCTTGTSVTFAVNGYPMAIIVK